MEEVINEPTIVTLTDDTESNRMNRALDQLASLRQKLDEEDGLTSDIALEHQALTGRNTLVNAYFSSLGRQAKKQIATEDFIQEVKSMVKKALDLLWDMMVKVYSWIRRLFAGKTPVTEAALEAADQKFKKVVPIVQRAERVPSSRTAIIAAVREGGLNEKYVGKFTPEAMDIYKEGPFHQSIQKAIPTLESFDIQAVVERLMQWHDKFMPAATNFDNENVDGDPQAVETRFMRFKADATRDLESATQMSKQLMGVRLQAYQLAIEERRKLKADPHFLLGTDLSGVMARGMRIFEQSGYKKMGGALSDVYKSLEKTVSKMESLRQKVNHVEQPFAQPLQGNRQAEEFIKAAYMKEVNKIISMLHQCVSMIQLINNYFSYVVVATSTLLAYVKEVAALAIQHGGDKASLTEVIQDAVQGQEAIDADGINRYDTDMK